MSEEYGDDPLGLLGQDDFSAYDLTRIRPLLEGAVLRLSEDERDARILHCWASGEHGVRMAPLGDGHTLAFWWDKRRLLRAGCSPAELS